MCIYPIQRNIVYRLLAALSDHYRILSVIRNIRPSLKETLHQKWHIERWIVLRIVCCTSIYLWRRHKFYFFVACLFLTFNTAITFFTFKISLSSLMPFHFISSLYSATNLFAFSVVCPHFDAEFLNATDMWFVFTFLLLSLDLSSLLQSFLWFLLSVFFFFFVWYSQLLAVYGVCHGCYCKVKCVMSWCMGRTNLYHIRTFLTGCSFEFLTSPMLDF